MISKRLPRSRSLRKIIIIVSGGETEDVYFENLEPIRHDISIKREFKPVDPQKILSEAVRLRSVYQKNVKCKDIETWIVIDKDHFDIDSVIKAAKQQNISVAYSNICFEVWYALHFQYSTAQNDAKGWEKICKKHLQVPSYSKTESYNHQLHPKTKDAIANAKKLEIFHKGTNKYSLKNPYTSVYQLVERLVEL